VAGGRELAGNDDVQAVSRFANAFGVAAPEVRVKFGAVSANRRRGDRGRRDAAPVQQRVLTVTTPT